MNEATVVILAGRGGVGGAAAPDPPPTPRPSPAPTPRPTPTGTVSRVHDPAILADNGTCCLFTTGNVGDAERLIGPRTSTDMTAWQSRGGSSRALPAWTAAAVPGTTGMRRPGITRVGNEYRRYHSISTLGTNRSANGSHAADPAADRVDKGPAVPASGQGTGRRFVGRGHVAILQQAAGDHIVYHACDTRRNGVPTLQNRPLDCVGGCWPVARQPSASSRNGGD